MELDSILIIDDDSDVLLIQSLAFSRFLDCTVHTATSGPMGIRLAAELQPDVILVDAMMLGMDGYETCLRLKRDDATRAIPVIFLSAREGEQEHKRAIACGAVGFITKEADPIVLGNRLLAIVAGLRTKSGEDNATIRT
ncbi:response regulator [bacterium]|nr:response regulator [candidate division CSSED10-310 bacterium]